MWWLKFFNACFYCERQICLNDENAKNIIKKFFFLQITSDTILEDPLTIVWKNILIMFFLNHFSSIFICIVIYFATLQRVLKIKRVFPGSCTVNRLEYCCFAENIFISCCDIQPASRFKDSDTQLIFTTLLIFLQRHSGEITKSG